MGDQTTNLSIGSTYTIRGKEATITKMGAGKVWYQGSGFGGSASEKYFRSMMPATPTSTAQLPTPPANPNTISKRTLGVTPVGSGTDYKAMWLSDIITTEQYQKTLVGKAITIITPAKTATSNATAPAEEPHQDTSLLKLTKKGSTKFYVIVCIILGIIIFAEGKIFKKVVK